MWNLIAFGVMGTCGLILNFGIAALYGADILGVFNQVFAVFIVASQICTLGVHFSVGKHIAERNTEKGEALGILLSGLMVVAVTTFVVCAIVYVFHQPVAKLFKSEGVGVGLLWVIPGLWCFAVNKTLLAGINGLRHMRAFASIQSLRYVSVVGLLFVFYHYGANAYKLPVILSAAEIMTLLLSAVYLVFHFWKVSAVHLGEYMFRHIDFIRKGAVSGALYEINIRVDVLMLGILTSDYLVGIYSLAAIAIEGVTQLMVVVRANVNPKLAILFYENKCLELQQVVRIGVKTFYLSMAGLSVMVISAFYLAVVLFLPQQEFYQSWIVFIWLLVGLLLSAGYYPFNMILIQTGFISANTIYLCVVVLGNIVLNLILIPYFGLYGAAVATGVSALFGVFVLKSFVRKHIKISI